MKRTTLLVSLLSLYLAVPCAEAYELATHAALSEKAYERSALARDLTLSQRLGIDTSSTNAFGETYYDVSGSDVRQRLQNDFEKSRMPNEGKDFLTTKGWLLRGAIREDDLGYVGGHSVGRNPHDDEPRAFWRVTNHFFDPVTAGGAPLTLSAVCSAAFAGATGDSNDFRAAPSWAVGSVDAFTQPNVPEAGRRNHFTVFDAREAMYRALTGRTNANDPIAHAEMREERNKYWATTKAVPVVRSAA